MKLKIFCYCSLFPFLVGLKTYQHPCTGTVEVQYVIYVAVDLQLHVFITSAGDAVSLGKRKHCCPYWNRIKTLWSPSP